MGIEKTKTNLRMISRLFILLGVIDIFIFIGDIAMGEISIKSFGETPMFSHGVLIAILAITVIFALLGAFVNIYLGVAGIKQIDGKLKGNLHIRIAKIVRILAILGLILQGISCIASKNFDFVQLSTLAANVFFVVYYVNYTTDIYIRTK